MDFVLNTSRRKMQTLKLTVLLFICSSAKPSREAGKTFSKTNFSTHKSVKPRYSFSFWNVKDALEGDFNHILTTINAKYLTTGLTT